MFDSLKSMGAIASLLKNKEKIAEAMARVHANLDQRTITVTAPDNSVQVIMTGKAKLQTLTLSDEILAKAAGDPEAKAKLQKTILGAITAAQNRVAEVVKVEVQREANELGIPELADPEALSKLMGR